MSDNKIIGNHKHYTQKVDHKVRWVSL